MKKKYRQPTIQKISVKLENSISAGSSPPKETEVESTDMTGALHEIWEVDKDISVTFDW
ncbi:hypothetical protein ACL9RF_05175 [Sphingobacterium sp. Mn56C]|uniref:hypothetical protein n=1 Tax=Sphingobacterium sp. Mn56C TaxID=3395261 RepID=UPI003BD5C7A6